MLRVAILTPDPADEAFHGRWREVHDRMLPGLEAEGVAVDSLSWTDGRDLRAHDLVLPLNVWGYHRAGARWFETVALWEHQGVRLRNPASVLRWNSDKRYLATLARAGAPTIPTAFVDKVTEEDVVEAAARFGSERVVVKPQVSAGAWRTLKLRPGEPLDGAPEGPAMIQPFLPAVAGDGELSLFYFAGRFSHAVRKVAQGGDFRVQPEYGGLITPLQPEADVLAAADRILEAVEEPLLYARVDLVRDLEGRPALIELELIEPDLYLSYDPASGARFARAVRLEAEAAREGAAVNS
jgi:glutathione synthase/RimK-type ligase-like ATP-grasp enzyme